jgi:hypothetical protein
MYATALDLNMAYDHQAGPKGIQDVYYHLPLGKVLLSETAHGLWDIFQAQIMDLMASLKFV